MGQSMGSAQTLGVSCSSLWRDHPGSPMTAALETPQTSLL
ncbi:hypothetical protein I547_3392 [Mycobacterium kansasii 824]|nr:hypothetical protein I547_3392 [Mycobacterium kansasii 824]